MFKPINHVYMDLDGVLVALEEGIELSLGKEVKANEIKKAELYGKKDDLFWPYFEKAIEGECFVKAPPTEFLKVFKEELLPMFLQKNIKVEVLSSITKNMVNEHEEIVRQKTLWLKNNGLEDLSSIFVKGSSLKQNYAKEGILLIDDYFPNIVEFRSKGGVAIHHSHSKSTVANLSLLNLV